MYFYSLSQTRYENTMMVNYICVGVELASSCASYLKYFDFRMFDVLVQGIE